MRLREIRHIIWRDYNDLFPQNELLLAHIYTECPTLTFDCAWNPDSRVTTSDWGWSVGLGQWHMRYRYTDWLKKNGYTYKPGHKAYIQEVREKFFQDHPKMKDWTHQAHKYIAEASGGIKKHGSIEMFIRRHNWNAGLPYLQKVQNNVYRVRNILNDKS